MGQCNVTENKQIDLRYNFPLGGERVDIVGGSNQTSWEISLYTIEEGRRLRNVNGAYKTQNGPKCTGFQCTIASAQTNITP